MNRKEIFQKEVLEEVKSIAKEISQVQSFSGLLSHQQKIQNLYEKYIFLKQLTTSKYQQILENMEVDNKASERKIEKREFYDLSKEESGGNDQKKIIIDEKTEDSVNKAKEEVSENIKKEVDVIDKQETEGEEEKFQPLNIQIAEIKPVEKEKKLNPVKVDFNDSIAFISQLFNGSKAEMDAEFKILNQTQTIAEAKKWMEDMFAKYNWRNKAEFVERLSGLIVHRFES